MTQELIDPAPAAVPPTPTGTRNRPGAFWRQPYLWLVVLFGVVAFNVLYALPRYLSFDESKARIGLDPHRTDEHFGFLVAHVVTGNIAMVTVLLQLWPWLRRHYPQAHRISGWIYILAGALPSALLGVTALLILRQGQAGSMGLGSMGVAWIATTVIGWVRARQHRYAEHQRWMLYSFALALGTSWGRFIVEAFTAWPSLTTHVNVYVLLDFTSWFGWILNLLVAHLWIESRAKRIRRAGGQVVTYPAPALR
ncbi:DUF2306 domain-containing protein [Jatrophihabitans sp.]|uniref:DUF2306 domain-containing protein n=1 Tax=Jatrophihabitans sp. TaxID=1932789 RepID=UPI002C1153DD|nr:DUF2306 domain-containing protein [Jatrophihabitans sp.]